MSLPTIVATQTSCHPQMVVSQRAAATVERVGSILVVDDNEAVLRLLAAFLSKEGFRVRTSNSAHSSFRALDEASFDIVIVDMALPDIDGLDLIREIRKEQPDSKIIATSGAMNRTMQHLAYQSGAACALQKPFTMDSLRKTVRPHLEEVSHAAARWSI